MSDEENQPPQGLYAALIRWVTDYIEAHLDGDLSVKRLSEVAGFSTFHFHRQFSAHTRTLVAKLIRMLRLKRANWLLGFSSDKRIIDVAFEAAFSNPETFARAFKSQQGQTQSAFLKKPE